MIRATKKLWWTLVLVFIAACESGMPYRPASPTPTPKDIPFMGVQLGGGTQQPVNSRPPFPNNYCTGAGPQGPAEPPAPFLYQPFEGSFNEQTWTAQMDHDQPIYRQNGVIATLGENLRYDLTGPGLAGGTEAYRASGTQWFGPDTPYTNILQQGFYVLAYQSPSFEVYLYYDGHDGHDFAVPGKALAAADGSVVFKGDYGNALGRVIEIYHPNGYLTRYAHLASFESGIEVGSQVKAGQPIGTIGGSAVVDGKLTDNYWGTHLHFSVFRWTGNEWHITDPFGWDPWAGPDQQSHLQKQRDDPLVRCNGEVSYNLWVGGWPQPVIKKVVATPFYPTNDRYVGGWLEEESKTTETEMQSVTSCQFTDDFSSYKTGTPPDGWLLRGEQSVTPVIVEFGGKGPDFRAVSFPEVSWQYWDKWLLKAGLVCSGTYEVTVKLIFQNEVADRAGITIAWDDKNWDRIDIQANVYHDDIEFRPTYSGPIRSNVKVDNIGQISIEAGRSYWLRVLANDQGPGKGKVTIFWSTDGINFQTVITADGLPNLTGLVGISTAGPHLPNVIFDDFQVR